MINQHKENKVNYKCFL